MSEVPENLTLLSRLNGKPYYAACLDGSEWHGYVFKKNHDGNWVSFRKLSEYEIELAKQRRDAGIVQEECTVRR